MRLALVFIITLIFHCANGQLLFSFDRTHLSEETHCFQLPESDGSEMGMERLLTLFGEDPLQNMDRDVFRIVSYGLPGDLKPVVIYKFERIDSSCLVTTKHISNWKKREVLCHAKTYDLSKWTEFKKLVVKNFWEVSIASNSKVVYYDDVHVLYEFKEGEKYRSIEGSTANPDITWLWNYLEYLISPIFESECAE